MAFMRAFSTAGDVCGQWGNGPIVSSDQYRTVKPSQSPLSRSSLLVGYLGCHAAARIAVFATCGGKC